MTGRTRQFPSSTRKDCSHNGCEFGEVIDGLVCILPRICQARNSDEVNAPSWVVARKLQVLQDDISIETIEAYISSSLVCTRRPQEINPPFKVSSLSNLIPLDMGNFAAWTCKLLLRIRQVKLDAVIMCPAKRPNASSSPISKVVVWLMVARLCFADNASKFISPRAVSVPSSSSHETWIGSVKWMTAGIKPVWAT